MNSGWITSLWLDSWGGDREDILLTFVRPSKFCVLFQVVGNSPRLFDRATVAAKLTLQQMALKVVQSWVAGLELG